MCAAVPTIWTVLNGGIPWSVKLHTNFRNWLAVNIILYHVARVSVSVTLLFFLWMIELLIITERASFIVDMLISSCEWVILTSSTFEISLEIILLLDKWRELVEIEINAFQFFILLKKFSFNGKLERESWKRKKLWKTFHSLLEVSKNNSICWRIRKRLLYLYYICSRRISINFPL